MTHGSVRTLSALHAVNAQWIIHATSAVISAQITSRMRRVDRIGFVDCVVNAVNALRAAGAIG